MTTFPMALVGGAVRDYHLQKKFGLPRVIKDLDFVVEAPNYVAMREFLKDELGVTIVHEDTSKMVIRGSILPYIIKNPVIGDIAASSISTGQSRIFADFALCGNKPAYEGGVGDISPCDLGTNLKSRDLRLNSIAIDFSSGEVMDPCTGLRDIEDCRLRFNNISDALWADPVRVIRAYRFEVTLSHYYRAQFQLDTMQSTFISDNCEMIAAGLRSVSRDRLVQELKRIFCNVPTVDALNSIKRMPTIIREAIFDKERTIWLKPTNEKSTTVAKQQEVHRDSFF